jgi:peptidyl-prolyl cis-trans isomerase SurA
MTVGKSQVSVGEFKYIYEKNNGNDASYSLKSINEYMDLYTKFKLKVSEAKAQRLDTIPALVEELGTYQKQLASSYIMDKGVNDFLITELRERMKEDVRFKHIFFSIPNNAADSIVTQKKYLADEAYGKLKSGVAFESIVKFYSDDKLTGEVEGDMGFYTAMLPNGFYDLETAIYTTKAGAYSEPIRSRIGWHIVKVLSKRPARGEIEVAHILVRKEDNIGAAKSKAESIYKELQAGAKFEELANVKSEDQKSAPIGGLLPIFGINTYDKAFEDAAFSIDKVGSYTKPIETSTGYHIIKLVQKLKIQDESSFKKAFDSKVKADERYNLAKKNLFKSIRDAANYKKDEENYNRFLKSLTDDFYSYKWEPSEEEWLKKPLITFDANHKYSIGEFADFCAKNTRIRLRYDATMNALSEPVSALFTAFEEEKTIEFEKSNLVVKYPDFRYLMNEYEEGILLFEVTKNEVWDKANTDTVGLKAYYEANAKKYMSEESAQIVKYTVMTSDEKLANKIWKDGKKMGSLALEKKYNSKSQIITSNVMEMTKVDGINDGIIWKKGVSTSLEPIDAGKVYSFSNVIKIMPSMVKPLKDSRGYVVADYQDKLEKEWLENLKKKFPVEIYDKTLSKLIK